MPHYKIRVLEVGYDPSFPCGVAFDFWHMGDRFGFSPFCMTLIQGEGRNILVDCGMDLRHPMVKSKVEAEHDENCRNPEEVLASVGMTCGDIDSVVVSHCHWDHMSGLSYFPDAAIYIQRKEVDNWLRVMADDRFPATHKSVLDMESFDDLRQLESRGSVIYLDGNHDELFPGIHLRAVSGHSFAQNMLFIENHDGRYAVIGDVAMRPESFLGTDAFPCFLPNLKFAVGTIEEIVKSYRQILDWVADDVGRIVMTHDGTRRERYPTAMSDLGLAVSTICQ